MNIITKYNKQLRKRATNFSEAKKIILIDLITQIVTKIIRK